MENNRRKWWVLCAMCLLSVMLNIDVTAINIAIPVIAQDFQADLASMQWVITAYVLLSAMFQIFGGRLGDSYGHRKIFLLGTSLFVLSSAGAGFAFNAESLIFFRVLQGLALGLAYPMTIVLIFEAFPPKQHGFALSFVVASMGISLAIGPPLGGLFVHYIGWRWIFFINVPLGIVTYVMGKCFCRPHKAHDRHAIDYKGTFFLVMGLLGLLLAINQAQVWGIDSTALWLSFGLGVLFLWGLYVVEKRQKYPIIDFSLFKIWNLVANNFIRLVIQVIFVPVIFFIPLYLQNIVGFSPLYTGLLMLFLTVVIGLLSPIAGKWIDSSGDKVPNIISMVFLLIASGLFYFLTQDVDIFILGFGLLLVGLAVGIGFVSTITGSVSVAAEKDRGMATGIIFTTAWGGAAVGVSLTGSILALVSGHFLMRDLSLISHSFTPGQIEIAQRVAQGILSYRELPHHFSGEMLGKMTEITTNAFMHGFRVSMLTWMGFALAGLLFACYLKKHKMSSNIPAAPH